MKISILRFFIYCALSIILGMIFSAYFTPGVMIAITNSVWAMCGW